MTRAELLEITENPASSPAQKAQAQRLIDAEPAPAAPQPPGPEPVKVDWFLESLKRGGEPSPNPCQEEIDILAANAAAYRYIAECSVRLLAGCEEIAKLHLSDLNMSNAHCIANEESAKRIFPSKGYRSVLSAAQKKEIWPQVVS